MSHMYIGCPNNSDVGKNLALCPFIQRILSLIKQT